MKKTILLLLILLFTELHAQQATFTWVRELGGPSGTIGDAAYSTAYDNNGNVFLTGQFAGSVDFDAGPGLMVLNSFGQTDCFVLKLNSNGTSLWVRQIGGSGIDAGNSLATDAAGNVYITGHFENTADFNPSGGGFSLTSFGGSDIFITKLGASGNHIWTKQAGGIEQDIANSIKADASGSIYTTGIFQSTADFDPSAAVNNLTAIGVYDNYVLRLDVNGNFLWATTAGGEGEGGPAIALDNTGNAYIAGGFQGTYDFNPGAAVNNLTALLGTDIFVVKLTSSGNFVWARQMSGSTSYENAFNLALDASGNVFVTGDFLNTVDFDPGAAVFNLTSFGDYDIFLCKLDNNGNFIWARQMGGVGIDQGITVATDISGNVYTAGAFRATGDYDPGTCVYNMSPDGISDAFISKLDANGNFVWAKQLNGSSEDVIYSIAITPSGNIYSAGYFRETTDFDPSSSVYSISAWGVGDAFIHKMSPCAASTNSNLSVTTCRPYIVGCNTYTVSGTYTYYLQNSIGCDSIVTLNLTISNIIGATTTTTSCSNYVWNGQTYTASGVYKDTLVTSNGCDSIVTLNLTVNRIQGPVSILTSCGNYVWNGQTYATSGTFTDTLITSNGCDSIATLQLTILTASSQTVSQSICEGQQYDGHITTGVFIDTLTAANGCDSIRTLNLIVMPLPNPDLGADKQICPGDSIKLSPGQFATYLWNDGSRNAALVATQTGLYSVTVTNNCGSSQDEVMVTSGICDVWFPSAFTPNNDGRNDIFKVLGNVDFDKFQLSIYNRWGQRVFSTTDPSKGWNGFLSGQKQGTGVFVWHCTFKKTNSPATTTIKGTVAVLK